MEKKKESAAAGGVVVWECLYCDSQIGEEDYIKLRDAGRMCPSCTDVPVKAFIDREIEVGEPQATKHKP